MDLRQAVRRREPIFVSKPFRFIGRNYKRGDIIDRRCKRMRFYTVKKLLDQGLIVMCADCNEAVLKKYGYRYDSSKRYPLVKLEEK